MAPKPASTGAYNRKGPHQNGASLSEAHKPKTAAKSQNLCAKELEAFLFRKDINEFLAAYGERPHEKGQEKGRKITLKPAARRFKGNEGPDERSAGTE